MKNSVYLCVIYLILTYSGPQTSNTPFGTVKLSAFLCFVLLFKVESTNEQDDAINFVKTQNIYGNAFKKKAR